MTGTLAIAFAAIVVILGVLSAWRARSRRAAAEAAQHSSGWETFPGATGAMPSQIRDLTPLNLGHDRTLKTAFSSIDSGHGRFIFESQFDTGFGERRRRYRFAVLAVEAVIKDSPRVLMVTRDEILASAADRPGFLVRADGDVRWISDDGIALDSMRTQLSKWLATAPPEMTIELRSGQLALYLPGELGDASQAALIAASDAILPLMQASAS